MESASLFTAILKVAGSLGLVIGIMLLIVMLIKKLGLSGQTMRPGSMINILETRMLAPKKYLAVVEIAGQYLVIGVTDHQINLITRLENSDELANPAREAGRVFTESPFAMLIRKTIIAAGGKGKNSKKHSMDVVDDMDVNGRKGKIDLP